MTQDEIIEMANKAGLYFYEFVWTSPTKENLYPEGVTQEALEAFAKLVAEKEREACAEIAESKRHASHFVLTSMPSQNGTAVDIANLIRAKGQ